MNYNEFITNHIKDHKTVACHEDCDEHITFNTIEEHFEKCNLVVISCDLCHERCFREDITAHKEELCIEVITTCQSCSLQIKRGKLENHVNNECLKIVISCKNLECMDMFPRD
jgi:hypothetical protein